MNLLKSLAIALCLATAAPFPAAAQSRPNQGAPIAADVVVAVNGLVCDFCAQAIDRSFRRRPEVNDVRVDLTAKLVSIDFRPNQNLDDDTIRQIVTRAGYTVTGVRRTAATP
jgi:cation transport ATPase